MEGQVRKGGGGRTDEWVEGQEALGGKVENASVREWTEKTGPDGKWTGGWGGTQYKDELVYWSQLQFAEDLFPRLTATEAGSKGWLVGIHRASQCREASFTSLGWTFLLPPPQPLLSPTSCISRQLPCSELLPGPEPRDGWEHSHLLGTHSQGGRQGGEDT